MRATTAAAALLRLGLLSLPTADARTTVLDYGQLKISLMTETIARVTFQAEDADLPPKYYAAVPDPSAWPAVAFTEEERGSDLVVISTAGMAISVNTSSLLCAFRDLATGEEVLREVSRGLHPTVDTDAARTATYEVEQSWERLENERIYGGGEYQVRGRGGLYRAESGRQAGRQAVHHAMKSGPHRFPKQL